MTDERPAALVTGAGSGIGRGIAERLAADGYRVACLGRRVAALPNGEAYLPIGADVRRKDELERAVGVVEETFGRLDALVTAAGVMRAGPAGIASEEDVEAQVSTNLLGTLFSIQAALPLLRRARGCVVTISSTLSLRPISGVAVYAATKGGVEALTRALAVELGPDLVRVNCIQPALVRSDIWTSAGMSPEAYEGLLARRGDSYPLGRVGEPRDIAALAAFLVSPRADWITGACVAADGGSSLGNR